MTLCPSEEELQRLLADALGAAERDALAGHVEECVRCQDTLARLTSTQAAAPWERAQPPLSSSVDEEEALRRLKAMAPSAPSTIPMVPSPSPRDGDAEEPAAAWPAVPGYEIVKELGRGGMGVVYEARQMALDRTVALKMVLTEARAGAKELARFRAEADVIARLEHPNIVRIYDVGEAAGQPYFALEFVAGGSLSQHLGRKPYPARPAAELIETLARTVHAAHVRGIIHRDLKPANILLDRRGGTSPLIPRITDFGLARCADDGSGPGGPGAIATTGEVVGTPNYMAPEQAMVPPQPVGPAADVYALGAILYELLTGRPPFAAETPWETILQVLHNEPMSVTSLQPNVPRDLETICLQCLHKEPHQRYASALKMAEDVERFLRGEPIRARPFGDRGWDRARSSPGPAAGTSCADP